MFSRIPLLIIVFNLIFSQVFFSEYAEGTSNNKYLEIYNAGDSTVDLTLYAYPNANGGSDGSFEYWNTFEDGATVAPGDVYVICHGSSDPFIQSKCDETHLYLSNGDDGYCLVIGAEDDFIVVDCIGDWNEDPGTGWDVAGVSNGTVNHTLARKSGVVSGNSGNWSSSAGTNSDDSEWVVLDQNVWTFLGAHPHEDFSGGSADGGTTGGDDGGSTDSEICDDDIDNDGDGFIDCDDFDCNCGSEDCSNGIDDDGDSYIDCDDFNCSSDPACGGSGGTGSCAEYGCVGYTPSNACQCNDLCSQYNNCCDDYEEVCAGDDGGSTGDEICDDGIDNDGDGYIDCDDWNCDGTTGDLDPACEGSTTGGGDGGSDTCEGSSLDNLFFSEYAEGSSNNKYLEIYNAGDTTVNLCGYAFPNSTNGADNDGVYDYWNTFDDGASIDSGDVFVICHPAFDESLPGFCDQTHTYLSNGDDGFCLAYGTETNYSLLDCIGTWSSEDPGDGWEVAGISNGTKDHTLVRKASVESGNQGDWDSSAGTNADDSEWLVFEVDTWDNLGSHEYDGSSDDCLVGDANGDGIVNVVDIVQMVSIILDNDSGYNACGDSNNDGILNVVDIVAVVSIILGS